MASPLQHRADFTYFHVAHPAHPSAASRVRALSCKRFGRKDLEALLCEREPRDAGRPPETVQSVIDKLSMRTPGRPEAIALLSQATRHLSLIRWPLADAGKLTVVVM